MYAQLPLCHSCGLRHYPYHSCPSFQYPTVDTMVTGGDYEENAGIRRYNTLHALADATAHAAARAASMARLENDLRNL